MSKQPQALRLADALTPPTLPDWVMTIPPPWNPKPQDRCAAADKLRRQHALIKELVETLAICKKELDLMPKSLAYDIHPGRQIERVLAKAEAQQ